MLDLFSVRLLQSKANWKWVDACHQWFRLRCCRL